MRACLSHDSLFHVEPSHSHSMHDFGELPHDVTPFALESLLALLRFIEVRLPRLKAWNSHQTVWGDTISP